MPRFLIYRRPVYPSGCSREKVGTVEARDSRAALRAAREVWSLSGHGRLFAQELAPDPGELPDVVAEE